MKITRAIRRLFAGAMLLTGCSAGAGPKEASDFAYWINTPDTNTIAIYEYNGAGSTITVPRTIDGLTVTRIVSQGFCHSSSPASSNLTSITIPCSVTNIMEPCMCLFWYCANLAAITVDPGNPVYGSVEGVLFDKPRKTLIFYPWSKAGTSYTIPNGVTTVRDAAFQRCRYLRSVTIPDSVTNIKFSHQSGVTNVFWHGTNQRPPE